MIGDIALLPRGIVAGLTKNLMSRTRQGAAKDHLAASGIFIVDFWAVQLRTGTGKPETKINKKAKKNCMVPDYAESPGAAILEYRPSLCY